LCDWYTSLHRQNPPAPGFLVLVTSEITIIGTDNYHTKSPCNHQEADTIKLIHLLDALENGSTICLVRSVDTDFVVIRIGKFHEQLIKYTAVDIWIAFGTGQNYMYLHVNATCRALGNDWSIALPLFHCYTGCDTTSALCRKGMGGLEFLPRGHSDCQVHGSASAHPTDRGCPTLPTAGALHSRPLCKIK
jgi:hypothetical protein